MRIFGYVATLMFVMAPITTTAVYAADEFIPITPDNAVTSINQVKVKKVITTQVTDEKTYTLPEIDAEIDKVQARIDHLKGDISVLQATKTKILKQAGKVKLLVDVPPPEEVK